jgi:cytochrome c
MHKQIKALLFTAISIAFAPHAAAADHGTADEANALVKKAVEFAKVHGKDKLYAEVTSGKPPFVDRDLYISIWDKNAKVLAHGANPKLVGKDFSDVKDVDGKPFMKELMTKASSAGSGWVDYKWENPVDKKVQPKSAYFEKVDDIIISSGYYKK